ncbi:hypothetical protein F5Y10DRAFT_268659 [Nemania abortiva]|nr:hypothetical protein F5Y10DRAFT_268659 [Nemania abortiva]
MAPVNPYKVLNVPVDADVATIQKAFKELSLKMHPDKANKSTIPPGGVETKEQREARERRNHERFIEIVEARETLLNPEKRREYDNQKRRESKHSSNADKHSEPSKSSKSKKHSESSKHSKHGESSKSKHEPSKSEKKTRRQSTTHRETGDKTEKKSRRYSTTHHETGPKPERRTRRGSTVYPETEDATDIVLQRLNGIDFDLNNMLSIFNSLAPGSRASPDYPEYQQIVSYFQAAIDINAENTRRVRDAAVEVRLRHRLDPNIRVDLESHLEYAICHLDRIQALISKLDTRLQMRHSGVPRDVIYSSIYAAFVNYIYEQQGR